MAIVLNTRGHVVPLTTGLLGAGQTRNVNANLPLEASLITDGALAIVDSMVSPPSPPTPPGAFKGTVPTAADLPAGGNNDGDVRLTADNYTTYVWEAEDEEWTVLSTGGGASAVLVQQDEPEDVAVNTLWVEIDDADPPNVIAIHVAVA